MRAVMPMPTRLMRGMANATFQTKLELFRNDGYGWELFASTRCTVHHLLKPPATGDPFDSSAALSETVGIDMPRKIPARLGDRAFAAGKRWTIGDGNFEESYASYLHVVAARPTAATPRLWITIRRFNHISGVWDMLDPQLVQLAWSRNQPDRLGGVAIRQYGWLFAPEEAVADLDIQQGDSFWYADLDHIVQWVPPDPTERREAIFWTNIGEGT